MVQEASKAMRRRLKDESWQRVFKGHGIDIGAGNDCIWAFRESFPQMLSVRDWDLKDGDAQYMASIADETFDFVHSSHCLEHMHNPHVAVQNWLRILKRGGYLVVTVPDEEMYEKNRWPSRYNSDHKTSWTMEPMPKLPRGIVVQDFLNEFFKDRSVLIHVLYRITDGWDPHNDRDQTLSPNGAECAIEFVMEKR